MFCLLFVIMLTYVLVAAEKAHLAYIQQRIEQITGDCFDKIYTLYGEYDLLIKIKTKNPEQVNTILREVKQIDGVQYFKTYVVAVATREWDVVPKEKVIQHH